MITERGNFDPRMLLRLQEPSDLVELLLNFHLL